MKNSLKNNNLKEISTEELKQLQLDILLEVDKYCMSNNLTYSLAYGTLLGAVRHGGYIPWDDDIDIMMPRKDYEHLLSSFKHKRYKPISNDIDNSFFLPYAKIYDDETILIEQGIKSHYGVNIDVFPIDVAPEIHELNGWYRCKHIIDLIYTVRKLELESRRSYAKNLLIIFVRMLTFPVSVRKLCKIIQLKSKKFNKRIEYNYKGVLSVGGLKKSHVLPTEVYEQFKSIKFENKDFVSIKDTDTYLTANFGDYMTPPPPDKRITHHSFKAYWKN